MNTEYGSQKGEKTMISDTMSKPTPIDHALTRAWHTRLAKRAMDILGAALGLLLLWPLFLAVALIIKRDSPGPVFFRGPRMGRDGRVFQILKFRTMRECAESYAGPKITAEGDGRITPLGKWLRNSKLNELPQLWSVLVGEMSLVGPRPEDPEFAGQWPEDARREILSVRPGITSPASISYHDEEKQLSTDNLIGDYLEKIAPDKIRLNRLYVRHHNLMTDLDAIFWTLIVLVPRVSIQPKSEGQLFGGPFTRLARPNALILWYDFWLNPTNQQTRGLRPAEIRQLFPNCAIQFHKITLAPPLARRVVPIYWGLAFFLESLGIFNTHYLAVIRKP